MDTSIFLSGPWTAADLAMRLVREYLDGWFLMNTEDGIPFYDLILERFRYDRLLGNWTAYVQPVNNPQTEFKLTYVPKNGVIVMSGGPIVKPIVILEASIG